MDSLTSTGESVDGETSWEYVEGEEDEEEGDDWEYEEVEEEPEVPRREVLICENFYSSSLSMDIFQNHPFLVQFLENPVYPFFHLTVLLFLCLNVLLFVRSPVLLFVRSPFLLSVDLSVCLFFHSSAPSFICSTIRSSVRPFFTNSTKGGDAVPDSTGTKTEVKIEVGAP